MSPSYKAQDLYQDPLPQAPVVTDTGGNFNPLGEVGDFAGNQLAQNGFLTNLHLYTLFWSLLVSFLLISNFFFYYKRYSNSEWEREKKGEDSLHKAAFIWIRYLPSILLSIAATTQIGTSYFVLLILSLVLLALKYYFDFLVVLQISDYFDWFKSITTPVVNLLKLSTGSKK